MIKIIASSINDLTTARYFAAMNVDYLAYDYDFERSKTIKEISDWVEGPKTTIVLNNAIPQEEFDIMAHSLNPDFIIMHGSFSVDSHIPVINKIKLNDCDDCFNHFIIHVPDAFESLSEAELDKLKELGDRENVFLEFENLSSDAVKFVLKHNIGLSLKASSEEEKTGVRSFEELDDVFDLINEQE